MSRVAPSQIERQSREIGRWRHAQQTFGALDAKLHQTPVGRDAQRVFERPREVKRTEMNLLCHLFEADILA